MDRRTFLAGTGAVLLATPLGVGAQQSGKVARIAVLGAGSDSLVFLARFREGMQALGYVEPGSLAIEYRTAEGVYAHLPRVAAELVELHVDIIVTVGVPPALAAKRATSTIPIIAALVGDPIGAGLVTSLARPGGNVTGISHFAADLSGKQVDIFKQAVPKLSRIGVLYNPMNALHPRYWPDTETTAKILGVALVRLDAQNSEEVAGAFDTILRVRGNGLLVLSDPFFFGQYEQIARLAAASRLPTMSAYREYAEMGGFLTYGPNLAGLTRRAAVYVDKILKGTQPGDLPVEQPTKVELVINLKTAKALGLTIPPSVLARADEVIQ